MSAEHSTVDQQMKLPDDATCDDQVEAEHAAVHSVGERVGAAKASVERSAKANLGRGLKATNKAREMAKANLGRSLDAVLEAPTWQISLGTTGLLSFGAFLLFLWVGSRQFKVIPLGPNDKKAKKMKKKKDKEKKLARQRMLARFSPVPKGLARRLQRSVDDAVLALPRRWREIATRGHSMSRERKIRSNSYSADRQSTRRKHVLNLRGRALSSSSSSSSSSTNAAGMQHRTTRSKSTGGGEGVNISSSSSSSSSGSSGGIADISTDGMLLPRVDSPTDSTGSSGKDSFSGLPIKKAWTRNPLKQSSNSLFALAASKANQNVEETNGRENEGGINSVQRDGSILRRRTSPESSSGGSEGGFLDVVFALTKQAKLLSFLDPIPLREASKHLQRPLHLAPHEVLFTDDSSSSSSGASDSNSDGGASRSSSSSHQPCACDGSLYFIRQGYIVLSIQPPNDATGTANSSSKFGRNGGAFTAGQEDNEDGLEGTASTHNNSSSGTSTKSGFDTILGQGDTVTSLLCFLAAVADQSLVIVDAATAAAAAGAAANAASSCDSSNENDNTRGNGSGSNGCSKTFKETLASRVARGVSARAGPQGATLWRLPPSAVAQLLHKYPGDVLRLANAITARLERVTLRTLVDSLGLGPDLFVPMPKPVFTPSFVEGSSGSATASISSSADDFTVGDDQEEEAVRGNHETSANVMHLRLQGLEVLAAAAGLNRPGATSTVLASKAASGNAIATDTNNEAAAAAAAWFFLKASSWREVPMVHLKPGETLDTAAYLYVVVSGVVESFFARPTTASTTSTAQTSTAAASASRHSGERDSAPYRGTGASRVCSMRTGPGEMVGAFEFFSPLAPMLVHRAAAANSTLGINFSSTAAASGVVALAVPASRVKWLLEKVNSPLSPPVIPASAPSPSVSSSSSPPSCGPVLASFLLRSAIERLSPVVFSLDWSLGWQHVEAGKCLVKRGGAPDSVFMVISGRLGTRPVDDDDNDDDEDDSSDDDDDDSSSDGSGVGFTSSNSSGSDSTSDSDNSSSNELSRSDTDDDDMNGDIDGNLYKRKRQKARRRRQKRLESSRAAAAAAASEISSSASAHGMKKLDTGPGFGRGSLIGEAEVLTERPFEATVYARRDSELVVMRRSALELVAAIHPAAALNFARRIAQTLHDSRSAMMLSSSSVAGSGSGGYGSSGYSSGYYGAEDDHRPYPKPFAPVIQDDSFSLPAADLPLGTPNANMTTAINESGLGSALSARGGDGARPSPLKIPPANKATSAMAAAVAAAAGGKVPPGLRGLHPSDVLPPERRNAERNDGPSAPRKTEPSGRHAGTATTATSAVPLPPQAKQAPPLLWHENIQLKRSPSGPLRIGNLAVLPVGVRASSMASFSASLTESLEAIAPTARATSRTALQRLGPAWFDRKKSPMFDLALSAWLSELEETHRLLLLEGDPPDDNDDEDDDNDDDGGGGGRRGRGGAAKRKSSRYSSNRRGQLPKTSSTITSWTRRCLRAADAVLLVVDSDNDLMKAAASMGPFADWTIFASVAGATSAVAATARAAGATGGASSGRAKSNSSSSGSNQANNDASAAAAATETEELPTSHWASSLGGELGNCLQWSHSQMHVPIHMVVLHAAPADEQATREPRSRNSSGSSSENAFAEEAGKGREESGDASRVDADASSGANFAAGGGRAGAMKEGPHDDEPAPSTPPFAPMSSPLASSPSSPLSSSSSPLPSPGMPSPRNAAATRDIATRAAKATKDAATHAATRAKRAANDAAAQTAAAAKKGSAVVADGLRALNERIAAHFRLRSEATVWAEQCEYISAIFHVRLGRPTGLLPPNDGLAVQRAHTGRLARQLCGRAVGLTLGGGGARGLAHLGVIRALEEAGIAIDMVGGTSQGALVGALLALYPDDPLARDGKARLFALSMSSIWAKLLDLTLPIVSYFSATQFNFSIRFALGNNTRIQDLWLPYHAVSTDISYNREVVHTKGSLWRSVRASMTLAGYLPPIWLNGSLLVDGGYLNVLPADVMATLGADVIIAVDVSPTSPQDYQHHRHPATTAAASTPPSLVTDVDGRPVSNNTGTSISNRTGTTAAIAAASAVVPGAITPAAPTSESPSSSAAAGKELEQHQLQNRRSGGSSCRKGSKKGRRGKSERMVPAAPPSATLGMFDYGASLSGWWLLWNRLNPFSTTVRVPSMGEINSALMWVSSERHLDRIRRDPRVDLLLRPPVQNVATLEYNRYDEVVNMGYEHAMSALRARTIPQTRPLADAAGDGAVTIEEGEIQNQV